MNDFTKLAEYVFYDLNYDGHYNNFDFYIYDVHQDVLEELLNKIKNKFNIYFQLVKEKISYEYYMIILLNVEY